MRIISLIPSATEIVYLLDLGRYLVARSHDSDFPSPARKKPVITNTLVTPQLSSQEIDSLVRSTRHKGRSLYHIDQQLLYALQPTLILTQELCDVCAISYTQVKHATKILDSETSILSLEPESIEDVFENILEVGKHTGRAHRAQQVLTQLTHKLKSIELSIHYEVRPGKNPTVIVIEWLDPIMVAGHWVPEMVKRAGGTTLLAREGEKSRVLRWNDIVETNPDIIVFAVCGFDIKRTQKEVNIFTKKRGWNSLQAVKNNRVHIVNGNAYFTRSGPRLIEGVKILTKILHPKIFGKPPHREALVL